MTVTSDAVATSGGRRAVTPVSTTALSLAIAQRSILNIFRIPAAFVPILAMPVFFVIAFSGSFDRLTFLPGFPTDNILNWMVPFAILQGASFAGFGTGFATVRDLDNGFYDRLLLSPGPRVALVTGPLIAAAFRAAISLVVVLAFGLALGVDFPGGFLGFLALTAATMGVAMAASLWSLGLVFRIQSIQAGPILQVGIFSAMFLSTGQVPVDSQIGWVREVARVNPVTNILRLARQGFLGDVTWADSWGGLLALAVITVGLGWFAFRGIRRLTP